MQKSVAQPRWDKQACHLLLYPPRSGIIIPHGIARGVKRDGALLQGDRAGAAGQHPELRLQRVRVQHGRAVGGQHAGGH